MQNRKILLEKVLYYNKPEELQKTREDLSAYGWDSNGYIVRLTRDMVISILERYLHSEITEKQVEEWADAIEMREDIEHGINNEEDIQYTIYVLASPSLEGKLTDKTAQELIDKLKRKKSP
jgi:hypothetical protein